jgi:quinol monooxygenase YgiN
MVAATGEIMALAVVEAFDGREEEVLRLLEEFYTMLRQKQYSRDTLYRDQKDPKRFINIRYWRSEETRELAHEDPDVHRFWKQLGEISNVKPVYERLEDVTPKGSAAPAPR